MNTTKHSETHTPGPWEYHPRFKHIVSPASAQVVLYLDTQRYNDADARLIAEAPAMADAIRDFITELDSEGDFENWERCKRNLRSILARIDGE